MKKNSRRKFLKKSIYGSIGTSLVCSLLSSCMQKPPVKRDVLFIAVDDLRDWVGYSHAFPQVKTPNIDRIAKRGLIFSNAYCAAPACCPSRTSLLTGKSPAVTGVYENADRWPETLRSEGMTLTSHFMQDGYYVAGSGKIYHGSPKYKHWHRYDLFPIMKKKEHGEIRPGALGNPLDIPDEEMSDYKRVSRSIEDINRKSKVSKFIACGLIRPHLPWDVPKKYFDMYPLDEINLPEVKENDLDDCPEIARSIAHKKEGDYQVAHKDVLKNENWKYNIQAYLASITFADAQIGRLIDAWDNSPMSKNGVIVLWGDHGWHLGEKEHWSKFTLWEEGTRTPLLFVVPGITKPGTICKTPVSLLDIYPTLMNTCNIHKRYDLDGHDLTPLLQNPELPWEIAAVTIHGQGNASARDSRWRYIHYRDSSKELYDHENDPHEWNNLATDKKYQSVINRLHNQLPEHYTERIKVNRWGKKTKSWFDSLSE